MKYYNDAMTHFESHKRTLHPANNVSKWSPTLVSNPRNAHQMAILGGQKLVPPDQLGTHFVENILRVNPTECKTMQGPLHLYQLAKNYLQKDTPQELYRQFLGSLPTDKADEGRRLAWLLVEEERSKLTHQATWLIVDSVAAAETVKISAGARDKSVPNDLE